MTVQVPSFESARIVVAGDIMLDRYWHGFTSRISPEAPVPVVHISEAEERPGGAANVALNIVGLGAKASLVGVTGDDDAADALQRDLDAVGIDCDLLRLTGMPTITKLRVLSRHQQLIRLDFEGGFTGIDTGELSALMQRRLAQADVVVFSDYGKGTLEAVNELIRTAREAGKPVLVDPKGNDYERYRGATAITPNLAELEAVVGDCSDREELIRKAADLCAALDLEAVLVTRGERGMALIQRDQPPLYLPAEAREVYDVTGAGDTVIAVLAAALAAGEELAAATALANIAAGIVVGRLGTATVSVPELRRALRDRDQAGRVVFSEDEILLAVEEARAHGERVVMTNGCFDILHAGHVAYLERARRMGERLIVAVNDDESVRRLKGDTRPINQLQDRMQVLAGLGCVDWVVSFSEDTPQRLICAVRPDVLVKGGDYEPQDIAGADCVEAGGGQVVVLEYEEGCSTSEIIDAIRRYTRTE